MSTTTNNRITKKMPVFKLLEKGQKQQMIKVFKAIAKNSNKQASIAKKDAEKQARLVAKLKAKADKEAAKLAEKQAKLDAKIQAKAEKQAAKELLKDTMKAEKLKAKEAERARAKDEINQMMDNDKTISEN